MKKKKRSELYLRYSIWLTALIVIVLIIILAMTMYNARERAIIEIFSSQQAIVSYQGASLIKEAVDKSENAMRCLAFQNSSMELTQKQKQENIRNLVQDLGGLVHAILEIDDQGIVRYGYPEGMFSGIMGERLHDPNLTHALKKMHQQFIGEILPPRSIAEGLGNQPRKTLGIGLPLFRPDHGYDGALVAFLSLKSITARLSPQDQPFLNELWLLDESGRVVFHPDRDMLGKDLQTLTHQKNISIKTFFYNPKHYSEMIIYRKDHGERFILAYESIRLGISLWWVVFVTPYDNVLGPVRKASLNIILGALSLIGVVLIAAISIARYDVKRLRLKEELKRLKEREEWQGKLLREKMTIDGIIEGSPVPTFVIDKDHKVILWNNACTELTGYSSKDMIGTSDHYKPFYKTRSPSMADLIIDRNLDSFDIHYGEGRVEMSSTIPGAFQAVNFFPGMNGKNRHLHFLAAPIYDETGEILAAIETFLDMTKELELTRSMQEYAENLQNELDENIRLREEVENLLNYLESIIDNLPERIFDLTSDGIIQYVSRSRLRGNVVGSKGRHFTEAVAPEHRDYVMARWEDAQKGIFRPYELEVTARNGQKRSLLITPAPVKGTDRFVLVQRDITERKELEKKYYESQKLAAIGQLSAGIAHEVRNPLSSIKMSLQILEKRLTPMGNDLKRFKIAQREVDHLEKLVSDVLIYAKPSAPKKELSDIRSVIEQALVMVEPSIDDKKIDIQKEYPQKAEMIYLDQSMIIQALINLFHNAADAMEHGGRLMISLKNEKDFLVMEIADNGCGIDAQDLPHLFNPFFTLKSYGTGLGLTQVRKIIDLHNGDIEVISVKGQGTRFVITLPRTPI
ncbi:MAG TPA: PAS domain S-box protein [Deltaproteobacteria bacterium]|nr:PAS domain S-box protein [Deltaproteobacteria bacterium]